MASYHMSGKARKWYMHLLRAEDSRPGWDRFSALASKCFGPSTRRNLIGDLIELRRGAGTVEDYINNFFNLSACTTNLSLQHEMQIFIAGLQDPIRTHVELREPFDLEEATSVARAFERLESLDTGPRSSSKQSSSK